MSAVLKEEDVVETRIARLESKTDIRELKKGVVDLNNKVVELGGDVKKLDMKIDKTGSDLRAEISKGNLSVTAWIITWVTGLFLLVLGVMAHGFKWI